MPPPLPAEETMQMILRLEQCQTPRRPDLPDTAPTPVDAGTPLCTPSAEPPTNPITPYTVQDAHIVSQLKRLLNLPAGYTLGQVEVRARVWLRSAARGGRSATDANAAEIETLAKELLG